MANELKVTVGVNYANGQASDLIQAKQFSVSQANQELFSRIVNCSTSDTALSISGITTLGVAVIQNLDATNYVDVGPDNSGAILPMARLLPGDPPAIIPLKPGITIRTQAHTAACNVLVKIYGR
jgi:hypothetical protein